MFPLVCALIAVFAASLFAQRIPDGDPLISPANGLSDEDGLLGKGSADERLIISQIRDLRDRHGYRLYLVVKPSLISTNPSDFAARLQQEWLPEGGGLVLVFESDTRQIGFGRSLETGDGIAGFEEGVPAYELIATVSKALEAAEASETTEDFLKTLVSEISTGLQEYFERKKTPVDGSRSLKLTLVTIGFLSLLALCGMGLGWLMGRSDKRQAERRVFPHVDVPERLSAPYGGGGGGYGRFGGGVSR
jgi:hypothetical protein